MKKSLVHVITGLGTGGAEMMLLKVLSRIDRTRFSPSVVSLRDGGTVGPRIEALGIPVHQVGIAGAVPSPAALGRLVAMVRSLRPDVVQGWMYHGNLAATLVAPFCGAPPVLWNIRQSLYSLSYEKKGTQGVIRLGARLGKLPRHILYNSREGMLQHEAAGYPRQRSLIIPNGFDTGLFRPDAEAAAAVRRRFGIGEGEPLIGMVARYHEQKDHKTLLRAAALLLKKEPAVRFLLAGREVDLENPELARLVAELSLEGRVILAGECRDVPAFDAALDIATLSSFTEGFPNAVGEAMACGVPCVVTDVGDCAWVVGETGVVVPPRDPEGLAAGWLQLLRMAPEKRRELGALARRRVEDDFSLSSVVAQYEDLYGKVVSRKEGDGSCAESPVFSN